MKDNSAMAIQEMKPAAAIELVERGVDPQTLEGLTQQVLLIKADSPPLDQLRRLLAAKNRELRRYGKAAALWGAVANRNEADGDARLQEVECLLNAGEGAIALKALERMPASRGKEPDVLDARGRALEISGRPEEAIACYEQVLRSGAIREATLNLLVSAYIRTGRIGEAIRTLEQVVRSHPDNAPAWHRLAQARLRENVLEGAEDAARKAIALRPAEASYRFQLATTLQVLGRLEEAEAEAEHGLQLAPADPGGLNLFGTIHKYKPGTPELSRLECAMASLPDLKPSAQMFIVAAKAKALEDLGDVRAALAHYTTMGKLKLRMQPYVASDKLQAVDTLSRLYTQERVAKPPAGHASDSPVFVVGMPRSGTSLLEQVLSSHSQVAGIGEQKIIGRLARGMFRSLLPEAGPVDDYWPAGSQVSVEQRGRKYVEEAAKAAAKPAARTLDKMPGNYSHIGPIFDMLPNAHVIHSMRHPIETCVSCFRINFGEGHLWSFDLALLGKEYRYYHDMVSMWAARYGDRILHVRYEDMVDDLERQARRLLAFIGLPFEPQCLAFHENPNPMRTASVLQVRQPLYRSSVDKWRKHKDLLKPLYDEIEDIVQLYERREGLFALADRG
jgi:tetratricopeptide (TPR) repeat protein